MLDLSRCCFNLWRHPSRSSTVGRDPDRRRHRRWSSAPVSPALTSPPSQTTQRIPVGVRPSPDTTAVVARVAAAAHRRLPSLSRSGGVSGLGFRDLRVRGRRRIGEVEKGGRGSGSEAGHEAPPVLCYLYFSFFFPIILVQ